MNWVKAGFRFCAALQLRDQQLHHAGEGLVAHCISGDAKMELRQLRYFAEVVEMGSLGRPALEMGVGALALSQQLTRLERELRIRLLNRTSLGAPATPAALAFLHHAQLTLRQADYAVQAAQGERLRGYVSVGLPPT